MTDEKAVLATRVKEFRKENHLCQFDFAEDCGLSKDTISLIERGNANVTLDTIQLLACRMGITVSEMLQQSPITYFVIPGTVYVDDEVANTYGIGAVRQGVLVGEIRDISTDFNFVKELSLNLTEMSVSIIHFEDIIEDSLF